MKQVFLFIFLFAFSSAAYCCSCMGEATMKQELKRSDVVFAGKVISRKVIDLTDVQTSAIRIQKAEYALQVLTVFKGRIKQDTVTIITGIGGGDCGFNFKVGFEYIGYSSFENKYYPQGNIVSRFLYTDICRRTRSATDNEEIKAIRKSTRKRDPD